MTILNSLTEEYLAVLSTWVLIGQIVLNLHLKIGWGNCCQRRVLYKVVRGKNLPDLCQKLFRRAHIKTVESPQKEWNDRKANVAVTRRCRNSFEIIIEIQTARKVHEASQDSLCEHEPWRNYDGWVDMKLTETFAQLELYCINRKHKQHGDRRQVSLKDRKTLS